MRYLRSWWSPKIMRGFQDKGGVAKRANRTGEYGKAGFCRAFRLSSWELGAVHDMFVCGDLSFQLGGESNALAGHENCTRGQCCCLVIGLRLMTWWAGPDEGLNGRIWQYACLAHRALLLVPGLEPRAFVGKVNEAGITENQGPVEDRHNRTELGSAKPTGPRGSGKRHGSHR